VDDHGARAIRAPAVHSALRPRADARWKRIRARCCAALMSRSPQSAFPKRRVFLRHATLDGVTPYSAYRPHLHSADLLATPCCKPAFATRAPAQKLQVAPCAKSGSSLAGGPKTIALPDTGATRERARARPYCLDGGEAIGVFTTVHRRPRRIVAAPILCRDALSPLKAAVDPADPGACEPPRNDDRWFFARMKASGIDTLRPLHLKSSRPACARTDSCRQGERAAVALHGSVSSRRLPYSGAARSSTYISRGSAIARKAISLDDVAAPELLDRRRVPFVVPFRADHGTRSKIIRRPRLFMNRLFQPLGGSTQ